MSNNISDRFNELIKGLDGLLPDEYPGSFIGTISALRQADKEFKKTIADLERWQKKQADDKKRDELRKEQAIKREKEVAASNIWRQQMDEYQSKWGEKLLQLHNTQDETVKARLEAEIPTAPNRAEILANL